MNPRVKHVIPNKDFTITVTRKTLGGNSKGVETRELKTAPNKSPSRNHP